MPQKTKAEIAAEKAALKESNEVVKLENEFDRAMNEGKDPNPFEVKAKKRSKGGGMDMGKKNKYAKKNSKKLFGYEFTDEPQPGYTVTKKMNKGGGMDMGQMPNTVKPRPRGNPGIVETVVGKGGDYIKDLID